MKKKQDDKVVQLTGKQESDLKSKINELTVERKRIDDSNQIETFKQALAYGGGYTAAAAIKYQTDRTTDGSTVYASLGDQLDMLYKDIVAGKLDTTGTWATHIKAVKDANPKPS